MMLPPRSDLALYKRLLDEVRPYWRQLLVTLIVSLLSIPLVLLTPLPLKIAVDSVIGTNPPPEFLTWVLPRAFLSSGNGLLIAVTGLFLIISLLHQLQLMGTALLRTYTGERLVFGFRVKLFEQAQRLSVVYHDAKGAADAVFRIQWDAPHIRYLALEAAIPLCTAAVTLVGMIVVTFRINWSLALIALTISPVILIVSQAYRVRLRNLAHRLTSIESAAASVVQEVLGALRVVKAFGRERYEQARFARRSEEGLEARIRYEAAEGVFAFVIGMSLAVGTATVLYVGIHQVQSGAVTLGELLLTCRSCPTRARSPVLKARSFSTGCPSSTRVLARRCAMRPSRSPRGCAWASWDRPEPGRQRSSACLRVSTIRPRGLSCSMA